ncbi:hypothetical protein PCASD_04828 [Puccinia coronata f. sp. avenae]|uniref:Uncharacterized protein n=1 Tax=Puccinia coronata f. sp. avenae TaxID=200324 RepID=A0A2N5V221_9BASI|nr:hypothetical protein PCASD_04828 [Puccinia coronata f. sp. avenae]
MLQVAIDWQENNRVVMGLVWMNGQENLRLVPYKIPPTPGSDMGSYLTDALKWPASHVIEADRPKSNGDKRQGIGLRGRFIKDARDLKMTSLRSDSTEEVKKITIKEVSLMKNALYFLLNRVTPSDGNNDDILPWIQTIQEAMEFDHPDPRDAELESVVQYGLLSLQSRYSTRDLKNQSAIKRYRAVSSKVDELSEFLSARWERSQTSNLNLALPWISEMFNPHAGLSTEMRNFARFKELIEYDPILTEFLKVFKSGDSENMLKRLVELADLTAIEARLSGETKTAVVAFLYHIAQGATKLKIPAHISSQARGILTNLYHANRSGQRFVSTQLYYLIEAFVLKRSW